MTRVAWRWLGTDLRLLTEAQVKRLLLSEVTIYKRRDITVRLHQRLCALRAKRERAEVLKAIGKP